MDDESSSIARAVTVLRCFTPSDHSLRLVDFVHRTSLPKTTIHRIVGRLVAEGLLRRSTTGFQLGLPLFEFGQLASRQVGIRESALPALTHLQRVTGLITHLAVLDAEEVLFIEKLGDDKGRLGSRVGGRMPSPFTAIGKAMLAFTPAPTVVSAIDRFSNRMTPYSIVTPGLLTQELAEVVRCRVAFDREESHLGVTCAASPIFNFDGRLVAALSVSCLGTKLDFNRVGPVVRDAATAVTAAMRVRAEGAALVGS
jgi:DNA-binding IclR family transcriptional regulator